MRECVRVLGWLAGWLQGMEVKLSNQASATERQGLNVRVLKAKVRRINALHRPSERGGGGLRTRCS